MASVDVVAGALDLSVGLKQIYPFHLDATPEDAVPETIYCPVCGNNVTIWGFGENTREGGHCEVCKSWNRRRAFAVVLLQAMGRLTGEKYTSIADPAIPHAIQFYSAEKFGKTHELLSRLDGYQNGEYVGPGHKSGDVFDGLQHQDLMATSFPDNTFDFVLTCDVFEHIPEPYLAHKEIHRILKPGGSHIFTVPSNPNELMDTQTALVTDDGIDYIAPAEYHGSPLDQNLVYNVVGFEMMVELRGMGYDPIMWQVDNPEIGVIGPNSEVYEARKVFEPTTRVAPRGRRPQRSQLIDTSNLELPQRAAVTAIVSSDGDPSLVARCLQSFVTASEDVADEIDALVVDNGHGRTLETGIDGVRTVHISQRTSIDGAFLQGLLRAKSDFVLLLTSDIQFEKGFLKPLLDEVRREDGPDLATPTVVRSAGEGVTNSISSESGVCLLQRASGAEGAPAHVEGAIVFSNLG